MPKSRAVVALLGNWIGSALVAFTLGRVIEATSNPSAMRDAVVVLMWPLVVVASTIVVVVWLNRSPRTTPSEMTSESRQFGTPAATSFRRDRWQEERDRLLSDADEILRAMARRTTGTDAHYARNRRAIAYAEKAKRFADEYDPSGALLPLVEQNRIGDVGVVGDVEESAQEFARQLARYRWLVERIPEPSADD